MLIVLTPVGTECVNLLQTSLLVLVMSGASWFPLYILATILHLINQECITFFVVVVVERHVYYLGSGKRFFYVSYSLLNI